MSPAITEMMYLILIDVVSKSISILIPLMGAFWIFKVREKSVSEGKIFELGREVANILQSKEIRGPVDLIFTYYIDKAKNKIKEPNHEKAIQELLQEHLHCFKGGRPPTEEERKESAEVTVAIATERLQSLVPPTVNWSGRGGVYSPFGEKTEINDSYFPFGTKLYRQWIDRFSDISKDLWAITAARKFFVDSYLIGRENSAVGIDKNFVENWLDDIDCRMKELRPIHAKLLTQIQAIDTQIDLPRFGDNVWIIFSYLLLLSLVGFVAPKIFYLTGLVSMPLLSMLIIATIFAYALIFIRIVSAAKPLQDRYLQRKLFLPALKSELHDIGKPCVRYRTHVINNFLSLRSELKLSARLTSKLSRLSAKIEVFNGYAGILYEEASKLIGQAGANFQTAMISQGGFQVNVADLLSENFELTDLKLRIMSESCNFTFSEEEQRSSRVILTVDLSNLSESQRLELCNHLDHIREAVSVLPLHRITMGALSELQELRKSSLAVANRVKM